MLLADLTGPKGPGRPRLVSSAAVSRADSLRQLGYTWGEIERIVGHNRKTLRYYIEQAKATNSDAQIPGEPNEVDA